MKQLVVLILVLLPFCFAEEYVKFDLVADKFSQKQTVLQKLEMAPVAYYGLISSETVYSNLNVPGQNFIDKFPKVYKAFLGWSDFKSKKVDASLSQVSEPLRDMYEKRYAALTIKGAVLLHQVIRVERFFDKEMKAWVQPKPEESMKNVFAFAYVGPDFTRDSLSWKLSQRMINTIRENNCDFKKRIFFLDGFSGSIDSSLENAKLDTLRFFPRRIKYDVVLRPSVMVREKMKDLVKSGNFAAAGELADSADMSPRSRILLKILLRDYGFIENRDSIRYYNDDYNEFFYTDELDSVLARNVRAVYEDGSYCDAAQRDSRADGKKVCDAVKKIVNSELPGLVVKEEGRFRFNMSMDLGRQFLLGDFQDMQPKWRVDLGLGVYINRGILGVETDIRRYDSKNDAFGFSDFGANLMFGYLWLKTRYVESAVFGNLGFSKLEKHFRHDDTYDGESYFRYGAGGYLDLILPNHIGEPIQPRQTLVQRFSVRMKFAFHNMNVSDIHEAQGFTPYVALGLVWHFVKVNATGVPMYRPRQTYQGPIALDCVWVD
ncbi:hypothetical protein [Fibrobacter sp. UBA4309]|uniref:hypothetical protein n=1 Tax=Fibrobacter sp. UBA4309 TaxID=1946537 RepID=UPI0025BF841B|nr:hypothetical protein [Fibrobacter sp. UBA4309]